MARLAGAPEFKLARHDFSSRGLAPLCGGPLEAQLRSTHCMNLGGTGTYSPTRQALA